MIAVWLDEPAAPRTTDRLEPFSKWLIVWRLRQVNAALEQIQIDGQPFSMQAVRDADTLGRIDCSLLRGAIAFPQRHFIAEFRRLQDERCNHAGELRLHDV